jgi:sulfide:quinone oxidoreductase
VDPQGLSVLTASGRRIGCAILVVCPGLDEDWDATPGLREAYATGSAASAFDDDTVEGVWPALRDLRAGRVVFTVPPEPAPCGATALKPLFLACDHWRRAGVLDAVDVHLVLPGAAPLGLPGPDQTLERLLAAYDVEVHREARVASVGERSVVLSTPAGERVLDDLAFAHVVPHYRAPRWVVDGGLAGEHPAGLVDVDPLTLRHRRLPDVWSLGDVADVRTRPSGGALRKQVAVLAANLAAARSGGEMQEYDGYTVMPITTARRRLMLVEVDRDGRAQPSVPFPDLTKPRAVTWWVDRYALPQVYWRRILRGRV